MLRCKILGPKMYDVCVRLRFRFGLPGIACFGSTLLFAPNGRYSRRLDRPGGRQRSLQRLRDHLPSCYPFPRVDLLLLRGLDGLPVPGSLERWGWKMRLVDLDHLPVVHPQNPTQPLWWGRFPGSTDPCRFRWLSVSFPTIVTRVLRGMGSQYNSGDGTAELPHRQQRRVHTFATPGETVPATRASRGFGEATSKEQ